MTMLNNMSVGICAVLLIITNEVFGDVMYVVNLSPDPGIYISNISLDGDTALNFSTVAIPTTLLNPVALDYDPYTSTIYWSDVAKSTIERYSLANDNYDIFVSFESGVVDGIFVDGIGQKLYWTSTAEDRIEVINLDGTGRTILFDTGLLEPRDIELDITNRYLYWTEWGAGNQKIERANLNDLSTRTQLITTGIHYPNGLVLEVPDGKMYWCDAGTDVIEEANLDGTNRRRIINIFGKHPFDLVVYGSYLYWTDWQRGIYRVNRWSGMMSVESTDSRLSKLGGIYIKKDTPICHSSIQNCEIVDCTSPSNCQRCMHHVSDVVKAYELVNGQCNEICSWRSDSNSCYPGTCASSTDSCICDPDFSADSKCMGITVPPSISECSIIIDYNNYGVENPTNTFTCQQLSTTNIFTPLEVNSLFMTWETIYSAPTETEYPYPYYVNNFQVGITSANITWNTYKGGQLHSSGYFDCTLNYDRNDPNEGVHQCTKYLRLSENLQNGDSLMIKMSSTNGGFLRLNNYDNSHSPTVSEPNYYVGKTLEKSFHIISDLQPPTHCSLATPGASTCTGNTLEISDPYTKLSVLKIRWSTWMDVVSGLSSHPYEVKICKMVPSNNFLDFPDNCDVIDYSKTGDNYEALHEAASPGVYCAILGVLDTAGNTGYAQRCSIFDDQSKISIIENNAIYVTVDDVKYENNTEIPITGNSLKITLSWKNHFANQFQVDENMLASLNIHEDVINDTVSEGTELLGRPLSAIANRNGIVKFEYGVVQTDAAVISNKPIWNSLSSDLDETVVIEVLNVEDDDKFIFQVRATDVVGNTKIDLVMITIGTSPESTPIYVMVLFIVAGVIVFALIIIIIVLLRRRRNPSHEKNNTTENDDLVVRYAPYNTHTYHQSIINSDEPRVYETICEYHYEDMRRDVI